MLGKFFECEADKKEDLNIIKDSTYSRKRAFIQKVKEDPIFNKDIRDITKEELENIFYDYSKKYTYISIKHWKEDVSQAYELAIKKKIINTNFVKNIKKPANYKKSIDVKSLTIDEQRKLSHYLFSVSIPEYHFKNIMLLMLFMGLRIGEVLALKYEDIDFKNNTISINKTLSIDKNGKSKLNNTPKTLHSNRTLPIPNYLIECLKDQFVFNDIVYDSKHFLFFPKYKSKYEYFIPDLVSRTFKKTLQQLNIDKNKYAPHSLRHTYATRLIESGTQIETIKRLLGHNDFRMTLDTYVDISEELIKQYSEKINEYYDLVNITNNNEGKNG